MGAFAAGGRTGIENPLPWLGIQQQAHPLGRAILHAPLAFAVAGQAAQLAAAPLQAQGRRQAFDRLGLHAHSSQGRQQRFAIGLQGIDPQIQPRRLVAGLAKGLGGLAG